MISSLLKIWQPLAINSSLTCLYSESATITDCSDAHIIPLSNVLEWIIELTANVTSAVSSIIAGVLPAPTPNAGLPDEYAALTIPGPPVANIISASFITKFVNSSEGTSIQPIIPFGAPAATAALRTTFAASMVLFFARGWGLIIIPFLVFNDINVLNIAVEVGFVVGITAATTPIGSATFFMPNDLSSSITPHVFTSL